MPMSYSFLVIDVIYGLKVRVQSELFGIGFGYCVNTNTKKAMSSIYRTTYQICK